MSNIYISYNKCLFSYYVSQCVFYLNRLSGKLKLQNGKSSLRVSLKILYSAFLGLLIAFGGTTRIPHAGMLEIPLIILSLFISAKPISGFFKNGLICIMSL